MQLPSSILLIEPDPIVGAFIKKQAQGWGYHIFQHCDDIEEAILAIDQKGPRPEIVVYNISQPIGKKVLRKLSIFEFLYHLPILFLSCASSLEIKELGPHTRRRHLLLKPFTALQFQEALIEIKSHSNPSFYIQHHYPSIFEHR